MNSFSFRLNWCLLFLIFAQTGCLLSYHHRISKMYATSSETTSTNLYARVDLFNCLFILFVNKSVIYNSLSLSSRQTDWLTDSPFTHLGLFIMQCDCCVTFYIKNTIFARLPSRFILIQFIHRPTDPTPISPAKPHLGRSLAAKRLFIDTDGWWYSIRTEPKPTALANIILWYFIPKRCRDKL